MKIRKLTAFLTAVLLSAVILTSCGYSTPEELPLSAQYIYNRLNEKEKKTFDKLYGSAYDYKYKVSIGNMKPDELEDLYYKFFCCGAEMFFLDISPKYEVNADGNVAALYFTYDNYKDSTEKMRGQLSDKLDKIISEMPDGLDDAHKLKYFHDWMITNVTYDAEASDCDNAFGALIKSRTHCQGFSKSMSLFCDKIGVPSILVTGTAGGGGHMWNMVQLDGIWYNLDVTWDDPDMGRKKFDNYFLISDSKISQTHVKDTYVTYPVASMDYSY